ncbi:MAG: hypothetical protein V4714_01280 [Bacteroidota bacterium]
MHRSLSYTSFFLLFYSFSSYAQSLEAELARLKTNTVLLMHSEAVEERALWSPRSDYVACKLGGKWLKISLQKITLVPGSWQGKRAGVMKLDTVLSEVSNRDMQLFKAASGSQPIFIHTKAGTRYALKPDGDGVMLVATQTDGTSHQLWSSNGEGCYSLSLSPDEKYLACICEKSGLLVTKLEEVIVSN